MSKKDRLSTVHHATSLLEDVVISSQMNVYTGKKRNMRIRKDISSGPIICHNLMLSNKK
jgi:hypothetical protein